jgi:dienelactone hydrolase
MMRICVSVFAITLAFWMPSAEAQFHEWTAPALTGVKLKTVAYKGWLPAQTEPLRGTLVLIPGRHGDGRGMAADPKWQELATSVGFAVIGCQFADGEPFPYQNEVQGEMAKAISAAVSRLAELSKHPELDKAPLAFWGISAGSNVSVNYATVLPGRVVAIATSKGTSGPRAELPAGKDEIPMLFAIGEKDKPEWVADSRKNIDAGLRKRAPWTLAVNKNEGHEVGRSLELVRPFLKAAIEQRFQAPTAGAATASIFKTTPRPLGGGASSAAAPVKLGKIDPRNGWLGDPETLEVAPAAAFKGNKTKAVWLPDETTAKAWQVYLRG